LGLERVKVSVVAAFRATLTAPNALEIVGGAMFGGGGVIVEEPPPQPQTHHTPRAVRIQQETARSFAGTFLLAPRERASGRSTSIWFFSHPQRNGWNESICLMNEGNPTKVGVGGARLRSRSGTTGRSGKLYGLASDNWSS
jgi:hypothetical protein